MFKRIILQLATWLLRLGRERVTLDKINSKLIEPVPGLIINGEQYYRFSNIADMPQNRYVHYLSMRGEMSLGMDRESLNEYLEKIANYNNTGDKSRVGQLVFMLSDSINNCTPVALMYEMAALVYFDKTEDVSAYDGDYAQRKIKLFKAMPQQSFFLSCLLSYLMPGGAMSENDISRYLRVSANKLQMYQGILSGLAAEPTTKTSVK